MHRDDIIVKNEQELIRLKYELDVAKLEVYQKKEILQDIMSDLEREKARYKALKLEVRRLEKRVEQLTTTLKQKEDELDQLEEMIRDRDTAIEELERLLGDKADGLPLPAPVPRPRPAKLHADWYRPIKGDLVDEIMAKHFNGMQYALPIKRLGDGFYMFGTRKIYAKLMQGKVVVRVGGGFMSIQEFMD